MKKRILFIDDDEIRVGWMQERIEKKWPDVSFDFNVITNEKKFTRNFEGFAKERFNLIVIDQMIPYTSEEDEEENSEALSLDAFRGGTRCFERLRSDSRTEKTPVLFYTILDRNTVPENAPYVRKTGDPNMPELLEKVGEMAALS
jgi:hypothetical protein